MRMQNVQIPCTNERQLHGLDAGLLEEASKRRNGCSEAYLRPFGHLAAVTTVTVRRHGRQ